MINYFRRKQLKNKVNAIFSKESMTTRKSFFIYLIIGVIGCLIGFGILFLCADIPQTYSAILTNDEAQVYDGDTLKDVRIKIRNHTDRIPKEPVEIWTGIWVTPEGVEVETDIRIAGIDTPEKRPSTKNADGTKRSEASRMREKAAALAAQKALSDLLSDSKYVFDVIDPFLGKYAGRIVASVRSGETDVATYLIDQGHAKPYDGGTKPQWNWGK